jgi:hypothetical protein
MNSLLRRFAISLPICLLIAGCGVTDPQVPASSSVTKGASAYTHGDLATLTYRSVDLLLASSTQLAQTMPLVVASVSDVRNVETTSAMGNIVSDMIRTRAVQDGYTVSEIRLRNTVSFKHGEGEFLLSRDRRALVPGGSVAAIVTGTYATSFETVYVSLKLVSATDAHIISAVDFVVPLRVVEGLLGQHSSS